MHFRLAAILAVLTSLPATAFAERYRVDLIVFLDRGGYTAELPRAFAPPSLANALEPDSAALAGSAIELVPDAAFGMPEAWNRLRNSRRYQPLIKLAWLQTDPAEARSLPLHIHTGLPLPMPLTPPAAQAAGFAATSPTSSGGAAAPGSSAAPAFQTVDGTIALRLSRYLFLDADLLYTQPLPDGRLASYRLREVRKMKRDEVHYLDSPRLGIVAKVSKAPLPK